MIKRLHRPACRLAQICISYALLLPLLLTASLCAQPAQADANGFVNTLMPLPSTLVSKPGKLNIDPSFSYVLHGNSSDRCSACRAC